MRAALGRVHVARRGAGEQRGAARRADADQAEQDQRRGSSSAEPRPASAAAARPWRSRREHRHAADAVHRAPGGQRRQRAGGEHDRRPEAEQAVDAQHEHERQRRHRRRELEHPGVRRQRADSSSVLRRTFTPATLHGAPISATGGALLERDGERAGGVHRLVERLRGRARLRRERLGRRPGRARRITASSLRAPPDRQRGDQLGELRRRGDAALAEQLLGRRRARRAARIRLRSRDHRAGEPAPGRLVE